VLVPAREASSPINMGPTLGLHTGVNATPLFHGSADVTHYEDLSPYEFWRRVWPQVPPDDADSMFSVGWLDSAHPFRSGRCPGDVLARLRELALDPVRLTRGVHRCELCATGPSVASGNGELEVRADDGAIYVAPALVVHYIEEHGYVPPDVVLAALRKRLS
jgi:hypothetical protein